MTRRKRRRASIFEDMVIRDKRCKAKDATLIRLFNQIHIKKPKKFHAVLMPNLQGSGLHELSRRGVPTSNIFAVERDPGVHQIQTYPDPIRNENLVGIRTTPKASTLSKSLDHIYAVIKEEGIKIDLFYLDFLARAGFEHIESAEKILGLKMLAKGGTLIFTLGTNRSSRMKADLQKAIEEATGGSVAKFIVGLWSHQYKYPKARMDERQYRSVGGNNSKILYTTSAFYF